MLRRHSRWHRPPSDTIQLGGRPRQYNHGIQGEPNTYSRGSKRLDYIFVSPPILDYVDICGIEPFHSVIHNDHRGLFVDLDLQGLLGGEMASILPPKLRGVSSNTTDPGNYILRLHKHLTLNQVFLQLKGMFTAACTYNKFQPTLSPKSTNSID